MLFLSLLFSSSYVFSGAASEMADQDTVRHKRNGILFLPILFYTPETKMAGGAAFNYYFRESGSEQSSRPSTIMPVFIYTQNKQIIVELNGDLYWNNEKMNLRGAVGYVKFPNKFYGIGHNTTEDDEENYTPRNVYFSLNYQLQVRKEIYLGAHYDFTHSEIVEVDENGLLAEKDISGSEGGTISGAGLFVNRDTRDNIFCPSCGGFYQLFVNFYRGLVGSDYDFERYNLDVRQYIPLLSIHIFALQGYVNIMKGNPPFQNVSLLGGDSLMRGYYEGRYRDKNMFVFQIEHRMPVWWRFGMAGFLGFGEVSDNISHFALKELKHSVGFGVRYSLDPQEKLNVRLDLAFGEDTSGFYITLFEAF